eukprot:TRINITY_DN4769_c0_g1_i1.p1 TRINITY_DN4769_c0_g1~~TRINITY_DN4769_c0_g1_i1.p1  ORF type:complete len:205 (-),score=4.69 TRINITY_DN4769_c0_g1_i1:30-644(-)
MMSEGQHGNVPLIEDDARCRKALQHHFKHPIEDLLAVNSAQSSLSPIITRYATPGHKPRLPSSPSPRTNRRQHEQESETDRLLPPQQKRSTYSQWSSRSYGATHVSPDYHEFDSDSDYEVLGDASRPESTGPAIVAWTLCFLGLFIPFLSFINFFIFIWFKGNRRHAALISLITGILNMLFIFAYLEAKHIHLHFPDAHSTKPE